MQALWQHFDSSISSDSLLKLQNLHVSILSLCSFAGRLLSGRSFSLAVKNSQLLMHFFQALGPISWSKYSMPVESGVSSSPAPSSSSRNSAP